MDRFEEVVLGIKERVDLPTLIGEYVELKQKGRYHVGLCPFHLEKTPSFTVYSDSQHFKCYGCGKAGDVFTFLQERDGLEFRAVMELLADRVGLSTEGVFKRGGGGRKNSDDVHSVLSKVRGWYAAMLQTSQGEPARRYLADRGLDAAVEGFAIGYHPPGESLRQFASREKLPRQALEQAGLLGRDGYERFSGRLIFPIADERGRVVGFGGRVLVPNSSSAKYLNSPESPYFNKRRLLFGLEQVKKAGERRLVVMEGYTDVIAAHLAGLEGVVATLGTSLTTDHARLLERYATGGVVLLFDGDRAGRQAAERAFRELVHTRLDVRIALLDEGVDPADLVAPSPGRGTEELAAGREKLQAIIEGAGDALTVWFRLQRQAFDLTLDVNVEKVGRTCTQILGSVEDPIRREALGRRMARHLGIQEGSFLRTVSDRASSSRRAAKSSGGPSAEETTREAPEKPADPLAQSDLELFACVLADPALLPQTGSVELRCDAVRELLTYFGEAVGRGSSSKEQIVGYLLMRCSERQDLVEKLTGALDRSAHLKSPSDSLTLLLKDRSAHAGRHEAKHIRYRLQQARAQGDTQLEDELTQEYLKQLRCRTVSGDG